MFNGRGALKQFAGLEAGPLCGRGLWTGSWRRDTKELSWGWGQRRSLSRWGVTEHQKTEGVRAHRSQRDQRSIAGGGGGGRIGVVGAAVLLGQVLGDSVRPSMGRKGRRRAQRTATPLTRIALVCGFPSPLSHRPDPRQPSAETHIARVV